MLLILLNDMNWLLFLILQFHLHNYLLKLNLWNMNFLHLRILQFHLLIYFLKLNLLKRNFLHLLLLQFHLLYNHLKLNLLKREFSTSPSPAIPPTSLFPETEPVNRNLKLLMLYYFLYTYILIFHQNKFLKLNLWNMSFLHLLY